ncbi:hypothetical protein JaAD80_27920 [Janthinobacterium sp. AD80]|nr:hypothetical protein JaAD80_27920 [Janthinobacterium sp. AD80]
MAVHQSVRLLQVAARQRRLGRPCRGGIVQQGRQQAQCFLCQLAVGGDLAAPDIEQRRARRRVAARHFQQVVARDGRGVLRAVVEQRAHARIRPHDVCGRNLALEIAVRGLAQVIDFHLADFDLAHFPLVFLVRGADQGKVVLVGDGEDDALVGILENVGMRMLEQARHDDVAALDQAQALRLAAAGRAGKLRRPRSCRVDDGACAQGLALAILGLQGGLPGAAIAARIDAGRAREDVRAVFLRVERVQHHQAGVVDPAVGIHEALAVARFQGRAGRVFVQGDALRGGQKCPFGQVVVQEQARAYHPGGALGGVVRHDEAHRPHDVRRGAQQHFAFLQRLAHQLEFIVLEVAQAAVYQLGGGGRGVLRQVVLFAQHHAQAAAGRVARDAGAIDAAADDQQVAVGGQGRKAGSGHGRLVW